MIVAGPILLAILVVGLVISVFQVTTQLQEMTLSYVPKMLVAAGLLMLLGPWMLAQLTQFAVGLYSDIPAITGLWPVHGLEHFLVAVLLTSLRVVPTLAFSPPFTLMRVPAPVRLILCLALSAWLVAGHPAQTTGVDLTGIGYVSVAASELIIGIALALALQLAFAALLTVGRSVDLQAGYAFAMIADPSSRTQMPLIGMIFAYAAAAVFFSSNGPADLLAIWSMSLDHVPLGTAIGGDAVAVVATYMSAVFVLAFGGGGLLLLVLFLIDGAIAIMSRTLPQMNVLFLGFQVKAIATLVLLPIAIAGSAALFLRLVRFALDTMLGLL